MGPKEPRDPYSGSGEAAGAPGHPGNVNAVYIFLFVMLELYNDNINRKRSSSPALFSQTIASDILCQVY